MHLFNLFKKKENIISEETYYNNLININEINKYGYESSYANQEPLLYKIYGNARILNNNISVFSGNSGVGKSTLINGIFDEVLTQEGEVSHKNKKGKNTTTSTRLYKIKENTYIADTPGFSTFDVYEIEYRELYRYFKEFNKYNNKCEYLDCTHIKEESCVIKSNVGKDISESRYNNYKKIYEELKDREEHKW